MSASIASIAGPMASCAFGASAVSKSISACTWTPLALCAATIWCASWGCAFYICIIASKRSPPSRACASRTGGSQHVEQQLANHGQNDDRDHDLHEAVTLTK